MFFNFFEPSKAIFGSCQVLEADSLSHNEIQTGGLLSYRKNSVENGLADAALKCKYSIKRKNSRAYIKQKGISSECY